MTSYNPTLLFTLLAGGALVLISYTMTVLMVPAGSRLSIWGGVAPGTARNVYTASGFLAAACMTFLIYYYYKEVPESATWFGHRVHQKAGEENGPPPPGTTLAAITLSVMLCAAAAWPGMAYLAKAGTASFSNFLLLTAALFGTSIPAALQVGWLASQGKGSTAREKHYHTAALVAASLFLLHVGLLDNTIFPVLWYKNQK